MRVLILTTPWIHRVFFAMWLLSIRRFIIWSPPSPNIPDKLKGVPPPFQAYFYFYFFLNPSLIYHHVVILLCMFTLSMFIYIQHRCGTIVYGIKPWRLDCLVMKHVGNFHLNTFRCHIIYMQFYNVGAYLIASFFYIWMYVSFYVWIKTHFIDTCVWYIIRVPPFNVQFPNLSFLHMLYI